MGGGITNGPARPVCLLPFGVLQRCVWCRPRPAQLALIMLNKIISLSSELRNKKRTTENLQEAGYSLQEFRKFQHSRQSRGSVETCNEKLVNLQI